MKNIKHITKNNIFILRKSLKLEPGYFVALFVTTIITALRETFLFVYLVKTVIEQFENGVDPKKTINFLLISLLVVGISFIVETYFNEVYTNCKRERLSNHLQEEIFKKILRIDYINYSNKDLYDKILLSSSEADNRVIEVINNFFGILKNIITVISAIVVSASIDYFIIVICLVLSFIISYYFNIKISKLKVQYDNKMILREKEDNFFRRTVYLPENALEYRLTNIDLILQKLLKKNSKNKETIVSNEGEKIYKLDWMNTIFSEAILMDLVIPTYLTIKILLFNSIPLSSFVALVNVSYKIKYELDSLIGSCTQFYRNGLYIDRILDIYNMPENIEGNNEISHQTNLDTFQSLEFKDVDFHYKDKTFSLEDINFKINQGDKVAIVGRNGSGKSTLINILLRLYKPDSGKVMMNNYDISDHISTKRYRDKFGILLQDFQSYATVLGNNISMDHGYDIEKINMASEGSNFTEIINHLVNGTETEMTNEFYETGIDLSGGELQRMALCRCFYNMKDLYVFDEPTSALDIRQEEYFYNLIENNLKDKTIIFTSHRLSSVKLCDKILFMNEGKIVESGTHEELIKYDGLYAHMYRRQEKVYTM